MTNYKQLDMDEAHQAEVGNDLREIRECIDMLLRDYARTLARKSATTIARNLCLRRTKTLSQDELWDLIDSTDTSDIQMNLLINFSNASLVMEATDQEGEVHYVAAEASFTLRKRDTVRAVRNARLLTTLTGRPAHAVVVGMWPDSGVQDVLDSEGVLWHQLDPKYLEVE